MKVHIVYRPQSEYARRVEEFAHDIERQQGVHAELIDVDSREGVNLLKLYDVMSHPAIFVLKDDGLLVQYWSGEQLPLMTEVAAFARS